MIAFQHWFYLIGLPEEKFDEVRAWVDSQYQDELWFMKVHGRITKECGGGLAIFSTYHPDKANVGGFEKEIYNRWHKYCTRVRYENWSDVVAAPGEFYGLWYVVETDEQWKNFIENDEVEELV